MIENVQKNYRNDEDVLRETEINPSEEKRVKDSRLLYELSKLKESSMQAIENIEDFSEYKQYMHIEREVEKRLKKVLDESSKSPFASLVLLCGSVGDGKSHLLGRFRYYESEMMENFKIHNDATESFEPNQSSLDTLNRVLSGFRDENIAHSREKMVLAINLGVLHNFLESAYACNYSKLADFISGTGLFKAVDKIQEKESLYFSMVNFGDYELFELTNQGVESTYISELLQRVTRKTEENPFYQAYLLDIKRGKTDIFIKNFELLLQEDIQKGIVKLIAKTVFYYKEIISARALFNFIYDILVPYQLDEIEEDPSLYLSYLLPNLIFGLQDRSKLLLNIQYYDPINLRNQKIDELLVEYYNTNNLGAFFKKYIMIDYQDIILRKLEDSIQMETLDKDDFLKTFIRFYYFLNKDSVGLDNQDFFDDYINTLYGYHSFDQDILGEFSLLIKEAVKLWNGSPKENYVYANSRNETVKISHELDYEVDSDFFENFKEKKNAVLGSYHHSAKMSFLGTKQKERPVQIDIDLPLYVMLKNVVLGYRPNKKDRQDALQMEEFMRNLIKGASTPKKVLMNMNKGEFVFSLSAEKSFTKEKYVFKRESL